MATKIKSLENTNVKSENKIIRYIYLGPNHSQALIVNATIYKGGVPENIKELLEKCPSAKALLIPVENTAKVMQELRAENTTSSILYKKAQRELSKI